MTTKEKDLLIEKAKQSANNSFVPYSGIPQGACVLTEDNIMICGCTVENFDLSCSAPAGTVAILKAVSEGYVRIKAVAIYTEGHVMPYLTGSTRQLVWQFGKNAEIIVANDNKIETFNIYELLPFAYEGEN